MKKFKILFMLVTLASVVVITGCEKEEEIVQISQKSEITKYTSKTNEDNLNLKSSSFSYNTSWMGWYTGCLDVPSGSNRIVVKIYNTNSNDGLIYIGAGDNSCVFSESTPIYNTAPPASGNTKYVYIPRSSVGTNNKLVFWISGSNLTGTIYAYDE